MNLAGHIAFDIDETVTLGEGNTALIKLSESLEESLGGAEVWCKAEHQNPTGSYKDRVAARAMTVVKRSDLQGVVGTSSGNGAAAIAAYGARAGVPVTILTVPGAPASKLLSARAAGAKLLPVERFGFSPEETDRVFDQVLKLAEAHRMLPFITAFPYSPEAMTGASGISLEVMEQLPETSVIYVPVGGGGLLTAVWKGLEHTLGAKPRLVAVQPRGSATLRRACSGDFSPVDLVTTSVSGLQVARLLEPAGAVEAIQETSGHVVEVTDVQVLEAQLHLARSEGIVLEPAGAVALAGAIEDARNGQLGRKEKAVLIASGAGWKDPNSLESQIPEARGERLVRVEDLEAALSGMWEK